MIIGNPPRQGETRIVDPATKQAIKTFLLGAVWAWCNEHQQGSGAWFTAHDFVGGANNDWQGTPCLNLYNAHLAAGKTPSEATDQAGKDIGHLLFNTLLDVQGRTFTTRDGYVKGYTW